MEHLYHTNLSLCLATTNDAQNTTTRRYAPETHIRNVPDLASCEKNYLHCSEISTSRDGSTQKSSATWIDTSAGAREQELKGQTVRENAMLEMNMCLVSHQMLRAMLCTQNCPLSVEQCDP